MRHTPLIHARMPAADFSHVRTWVFDLDNTLYPPAMRLFDQIEARMTAYVMNVLNVDRTEADRLRVHYWHTHGTTLAGLMREHGLDPLPFLEDVHDIDFGGLSPDALLATRIAALPGRKIVYTNGCAPYAEQVLAARGLSGIFDAVYGVEHANFQPKPERAAFDRVFQRDGLIPTSAAMFEDEARNLAVPHDVGMRTVHVAPSRGEGDHIHYHAEDLSTFLERLVR